MNRLAIQIAVAAFTTSTATVAALDIPESYVAAANSEGIPPDLFFALVSHESGTQTTKGRYMPWPWTINHAGQSLWFPDRHAMHRYARSAISGGDTMLDLGPAQVNWHWHKDKFESLWAATNPHHSLAVSAHYLADWQQVEQNWWAAIGKYHSPSNHRRASAYSDKVKKHWQRLFGNQSER